MDQLKKFEKLHITYERINQTKEPKIMSLGHKYELFKIEENKSIGEMFTRLRDVINGLKAFSKIYSNTD